MGELLNIKGIGPKTEQYFNNIDIYDAKDLLYYFPRDYEAYEEPIKVINIEVGKLSTIKALVVTHPSTFRKGKLSITWCWLDDGTGRIRAYWFNLPFVNKTLSVGKSFIFRGKASEVKNGIALSQCKIFKEETYNSFKGSLSPVYSLTKGLTNNNIKNFIKSALDDKINYKDVYKEYLPKEILEERNLCSLSYAINHMHYPKSMEDMLKARNRLVYDEFFLFSLAMQNNKNQNKKVGREDFKNINEKILNDVIKELPYKLTKSQISAIKDIISDFKSTKKMNRLIEGDVGSGKTIVAILTAYLVAIIGIETAFMAPTEVLAEQHFENILKFNFAKKYEPSDTLLKKEKGTVIVALLTGSTKTKERKEILKGLNEGVIDILVGTHALFSKDVVYKDLGYIIIDEQHKFGVGQRKALEDKSNNANVLIMSATPIPRTLSMLYYADMDISRIIDKPQNRIPIKNYIAKVSEREKSFNSMKKQIDIGHQAYVICAAVEKNDEDDIGSFANYQNVYDYAEMLKKYYGKDIKIEVLHGKMKPDEKYDIMQRFKNNEIQILVSTTVVEVGVDVPNATYLMVEDAGSFGLAELHQLRGRVGRGDAQSYALFVDTNPTEKSEERLKILATSNDGFYIAEEDLRLRGPGDIFGVRQSGDMEFKLADMYTDIGIFRNASNDAKEFIEKGIEITDVMKERLKKYLDIGYVI